MRKIKLTLEDIRRIADRVIESNLPPSAEIQFAKAVGDLTKSREENEEFKDLVDEIGLEAALDGNLNYQGTLNLNYADIDELPDGLRVRGSLLIKNTNISFLPDDLYVGGTLDISGTDIDDIPRGLHVGVNMIINDTPLDDEYTESEVTDMIDHIGGEVFGQDYLS